MNCGFSIDEWVFFCCMWMTRVLSRNNHQNNQLMAKARLIISASLSISLWTENDWISLLLSLPFIPFWRHIIGFFFVSLCLRFVPVFFFFHFLLSTFHFYIFIRRTVRLSSSSSFTLVGRISYFKISSADNRCWKFSCHPRSYQAHFGFYECFKLVFFKIPSPTIRHFTVGQCQIDILVR